MGLGPRELAEAMRNKNKVMDSETGVVFTPITVDVTGNVAGITDDGKTIQIHAKNLEIAKGTAKSDAELLEEMMNSFKQ